MEEWGRGGLLEAQCVNFKGVFQDSWASIGSSAANVASLSPLDTFLSV